MVQLLTQKAQIYNCCQVLSLRHLHISARTGFCLTMVALIKSCSTHGQGKHGTWLLRMHINNSGFWINQAGELYCYHLLQQANIIRSQLEDCAFMVISRTSSGLSLQEIIVLPQVQTRHLLLQMLNDIYISWRIRNFMTRCVIACESLESTHNL